MRGELPQITFADCLATQCAGAVWTGTPPVHQDELHMQPPPEKFVAFKAEANVVRCARQLRTGLYRPDIGWRGLGDWNQTSSTLGRAPDGRIRWGNAFGQSESRSRHDHFGNAFRIGRNVIASARIKRRSRRHHNRPPAA